MTLNTYLQQAKEKKQAIGHFNFSSEDVLRAIIVASKESGAYAVMVATSEGEAGFVGMKEAVALVGVMREEYNFPVFLNADHYKSFEKCKEAIDAGYDSVLIDASKLPYEENISLTKKVFEYAKSVNPDISVEGELGYLRGSSEIQTKVEISPSDYTKPTEAETFVEATGVDRLAIVFGNIHGIVTDQKEELDIEHLKTVAAAVPNTHLVLHGASGLADANVAAAIASGIVNIHFNTELRVAYTEGIKEELAEHPQETTPYKYLQGGAEEVKKVVSVKTKLFLGL